VQNATFLVLINGAPSNFFKATRGIHQACPLALFLFILVAKALRRLINAAKIKRIVQGTKVSRQEYVMHLLFVDDMLCMLSGSISEAMSIQKIIILFNQATGTMINEEKSCILFNEISELVKDQLSLLIPYPSKYFLSGFKYIGFFLKPNSYRYMDWSWM